MTISTVPYVDAYRNVRDANATLEWNTYTVKMAGQERWRFIVTVERITLSDGTNVKGGFPKVFVRLQYSQMHSIADARQALTATTQLSASQYQVTPERISVEENGEVSVFFVGNSLPETGLGWSKAILTPTERPSFWDSDVK
jgi:hypothetical protein